MIAMGCEPHWRLWDWWEWWECEPHGRLWEQWEENFELGTSCKLAPAWGTLPNNMLLFLYLFSLNQPLSELAKLKLIITTLLNFNTLCQSLRDFDKVFLFSRIEIC